MKFNRIMINFFRLVIALLFLTIAWLMLCSNQQDRTDSKAAVQTVTQYPLTENQISTIMQQSFEQYTFSQLQEGVDTIAELPGSLRDSVLPLSLDVSVDGDLVINKKIQSLFDFYLSALGEESLEVVVARIKQRLELQLASPALDQAYDILTGYLQYLNEVTAIRQQYKQDVQGEYSLDDVINARKLVLDARTEFLDPEVIAVFFEQTDQYEEYMLGLAAVTQNSALTREQKQQVKADLDAAAPEWLLAQQQNANQLNEYRNQYQELKSQGATEDELRDFTQQQFSPEVAERLVELEEQRQQWQLRLNEYRDELNGIITTDMDEQQRQEQTEQLRELYFSEQEIKRVRALDNAYLAKQIH